MRRALGAAERLPLLAAAAALFAMMALTFCDVALRSVASAPIPGAAEVTEVLLAAVVFLTLPVASLHGRHIAADLGDALLSPAARRRRDAAVNLACAAALVWPIRACWEGAMRTLGYGEVTLYLRIPVGWIALLVVAGLAASAMAMAARGLALALRPEWFAEGELAA